MTLSRTANLMCVLVMLAVDSTAAELKMTALAGENVLLPCPCSKATDQVTWQIDESIVVNHYSALVKDNRPPADSFKDRSRLFMPNQKGNCSLLLFRVSSEDQKIFTCYTFVADEDMNKLNINLTVTEPKTRSNPSTDPPAGESKKPHAGFLVGVLLLLAVVSGVIGALLLRKQRQKIQRTVFMDPQAGLPIVELSPV
ncbi:uncharacterized protein si:dkey-192g7.3 [Colossoma macropomum]|uniref:uncharacterized protein si:dkey-192g7.3 n=1 Tax=Colossoma macropomum TaxID=42526 RepID=UPI00186552AE|nr:uncharacterized protein si:dkey-192g7.3 [Colossoma macropomum]